MSPATARCGGDPSSAPSSSSQPPSPPQSDPFDFILEECGRLSHSQEELLRNAPFLRQEKLNPANLPRDKRALTNHILYCIFGFENSHHPSRRPPYTDAEAAELALTDYYMRLGPRRPHLLQPQEEGNRAGRTQCPSGTREAAKESPEAMPPPAEAHPSCLPVAAAATPAAPVEGEKDKLAGLKRGRADPSHPSRSRSQAADDRSSMGKKACVNPGPVDPPVGTSSSGAGVTSTGDMPAVGDRPPSADGGGPRRRNLPPSILCPDNWGDGRAGYERGTRLRPSRPPLQVDQMAKGKAPVAGAVSHSPSASSSLCARTPSSADAAGVKEQGLDKGGASGRPSPSVTFPVEGPPPPSARREATSPSVVRSDAVSLSGFIEALLKFSNRPNQTPEKVDPFEALAKGGFSLPVPKWWRPGGYGGRSTPPDK